MSLKVNDKVKLAGKKPSPPRMYGHKQEMTKYGNPIVHSVGFGYNGVQGKVFYGTTYVVSEKTDLVDNESSPHPRINKDFINSSAQELFELVESAQTETTE